MVDQIKAEKNNKIYIIKKCVCVCERVTKLVDRDKN